MVDDLKTGARRIWEEIFPACDAEALAEVIAVDSVDHSAPPDEPQGFEGAKRAMLWLARVFSDQRWQIHKVVAESDIVVLYCTHHARHTGELMGIPPTGRVVAYDYVHIVRFLGGQVVEHWGIRDDMTLMRQLGVLPERPTPALAGI